ncbi:MAG: thiopeptide-type bacteriocin biosynthesis protein [Acidobacteriota bacterium]
MDTFAEYVKNRPETVLLELYPGAGEWCVEGPEGKFVHELVIPFVRTSHNGPEARLFSPPADQPTHAAPSLPRKGLPRTFPPGSEWLYVKFYCGLANADRLLLGLVTPLVRQALHSQAADGWFFIRYADPDPHLRVRFHGAPQRLLLEVLAEIRAQAEKHLRAGLLHRLEICTYEREVERYGGPEGMLLCEQLFQADSEAVIGILGGLTGDAGAQARWKLALIGASRLLGDLALENPTALALLTRLKEGYFQEFGGTVALKKALGGRYRKERAAVETLLEMGESGDPSMIPGLRVLEERSRKMAPVIAALRKKRRQGHITVSLPDLAASLLHMHINRMVRARARAHEAVLYTFLAQACESRMARLKKEANRTERLEAVL